MQAYFQAADIINQVLNFGLPAAIDVQISGNDLDSDYAIAARLQTLMAQIPGVADLRIAEPLDYPAFKVDADRVKALELEINEEQVASSLLASLSGATLLQPNFWLDPENGVNYRVIAQTPYHIIDSTRSLANTPLTTVASSQTPGLQPAKRHHQRAQSQWQLPKREFQSA